MLTIFEGFRVPGVPNVDIFRDSDRPDKFYLLPDQPSVAVAQPNDEKMFSYNLIARDVDIVLASAQDGVPAEFQVGYLTTTMELNVSEANIQIIRTHLQDKLQNERNNPSIYNKLFSNNTSIVEPEIGLANTWIRGTARVDLLNGLGSTFLRASSETITPNLTGTCSAAFWATFGAEGSQLMFDALQANDSDTTDADGALPLQCNVRYDLVGYARVPELKVSVHADGSTVYRELRERMRVVESGNGKRFSYPQISKLVKELTRTDAIEINWQDFGIPDSDPDASTVKDRLSEQLISVITTQITQSFFSEMQLQGIQDEDLGETFTHLLGGKPGNRLWLNEFREEFVSDIDLNLTFGSNMTFTASPQCSVLAVLTPEEVERKVRFLDVGNPQVQVLNLQLETNADFEGDDIANITTTFEYNHFDTQSNRTIHDTESFVFRKSEDRFMHTVRMARDDQGRLLDTYSMRAAINYRGTSEAPSPITLEGINDRALTLSYNRLGFINVELFAGDIDWSQISDVFVDFTYTAAATEADAAATLHLTKDSPQGRWNASKHGRDDNRYQYTVRYKFIDGTESQTLPVTDRRNTLVIHDTLISKLRRTFEAVISEILVRSVSLRVRNFNAAGEQQSQTHVFTQTESWDYVQSLSEGASRDIEYRYIIEYADGHVEHEDWRTVSESQTLEPIIARRIELPLWVDGGGLDWEHWRAVFVELTYADDEHQFTSVHQGRLSVENSSFNATVLAFSSANREYGYRVTFQPMPESGDSPEEVNGRNAGILLLETLLVEA